MTGALQGPGLGDHAAPPADGRFSGGFMLGHAAHGDPITIGIALPTRH